MQYKLFVNSVILVCSTLIFYGCAKSKEEKELHVSDHNISIRLEAAVYPIEKQDIISTTSGTVKEIFVKNGERVKKGDIIFTLDKELIQLDIKNITMEISSLEQIKQNAMSHNSIDGSVPAINLAAQELKKIAYLKAEGFISSFEENNYKKNYINAMFSNKTNETSEFEKIRTLNQEITSKKIELQKMQYQIKHADNYANIEGFIAGFELSKGEPIGDGKKVGNIINIDKVIVKAGFATGLLPFIHKNQKVTIDFITTPPIKISTKISKVNPIVDKKFDRMTLEIIVPNKNYLLQDGTNALVTITVSKTGQNIIKKYLLNNKQDTILEIKSNIY